ncbi:hypothetical protein LIER_13792 [Lithospermum erythrorhizon]|uniref:Uncharacterized protein n=1 Tax=Lithospermum erythrorhizon TaxID=34254 RepID=A0AAV3PWQ9_LITER
MRLRMISNIHRTEAKEPPKKNGASISGSGMKEVQCNILSSRDTSRHDHCQAKENDNSTTTGAKVCDDVTKELEHMDISEVKCAGSILGKWRIYNLFNSLFLLVIYNIFHYLFYTPISFSYIIYTYNFFL